MSAPATNPLASNVRLTDADYGGETNKYNIPLGHLEYGYIGKCKDAKYLEKIVKELRAGTEGSYPDLERFAEKRLAELNPKSRVLRKETPLSNLKDLPKSEAQQLLEDMESFRSEIKVTEEQLKDTLSENAENLPPPRSANMTTLTGGGKTTATTAQKAGKKSAKPREYRDWDKINVDEELEKIDTEDKAKPSKNIFSDRPTIPETVDTSGWSDADKTLKAGREKDKGNEAFRSGDYKEALVYYNRSMSIQNNVPACNNRAQCYLKLERHAEAVADSSWVLSKEPENLKAFLRRATGHHGDKKYIDAKKDLQKVLQKEPQNKRALEVLDQVNKALEEQKVKGRRMVIEESDGSDSESDDNEQVNGHTANQDDDDDDDDDDDVDLSGIEVVERKEVGKKEAKKEVNEDDLAKLMKKVEELGGDPKEIMNSVESDIKNNESDKKSIATDKKSTAAPKKVIDKKDDGDKIRVDKEPAKKTEMAESTSEKSVPAPQQPPPPLPDAVAFLKSKGNDLFKNGQYGDAIEAYDKAILKLSKDPSQYQNLSVLYNNRAMCRHKIGDCTSCIADCTKALDLTPGNSKAHLRRAMAYEAKEKYIEAYMDYRHVLYADNTADVAHQGSTRCTKMLQEIHGINWRNKLPVFQPATSGISSPAAAAPTTSPAAAAPLVTTSPSSSLATNTTSSKSSSSSSSKGTTITSSSTSKSAPPAKGSNTKASASSTTFSSSSSAKVDTPAADPEKLYEECKGKGNTFVQKGRFKEAISQYEECIRLFPNRAAPYTNKALCHLRILKPEKAITDCEAALACEPHNVKALFRKGQALKMNGNHDAAAKAFVEVLQVEKDNKAASKELQEIITFKKQMEKNKEARQSKESPRKKVQIIETDSSDSSDEEKECPLKAKRANPVQNKPQQPPQPSRQPSSPSTKQPPKQPNTQTNSPTKPQARPSEPDKKPGMKEGKKNRSKKGKRQDSSPTITAPELQNVTPYEFISAWNGLKGTNETSPYAKLLEQVPPHMLPKVVSNKLEVEMLLKIVRSVGMFIEKGDVKTSFHYLEKLTQVPRFDMTTMLLGKNDKQEISTVLNKLHTHTGECFAQSDLDKVIKAYGL